MHTTSLLRKGFAVGIIILLGTNILPSMSCSSTENHQSIGCSSQIGLNTISDLVNWTINGTMGNYGWYISPITFTCTYDHNVVAAVYSNLNGLYTGPFTIYTEGALEFYWWWVDYQGTVSGIYGPYAFGIDYTPPTITLTVTPLNWFKTQWLLNVTVADAISGVMGVELFVDDHSIGNLTAYPYTFIYKGHGKTAQARTMDFAGNLANSTIMTPCIQDQGNSILRQIIMLLRNLIDNLLFHHQMKGWNQ
jgi:hypothetical protein